MEKYFLIKKYFSTFFHVFPTFSTFFPSKTLLFLRKNLKSEKNILFQFFIHVTVFSKMFPHLIWHFQSYLGRKKGTSETFLSLGLFISRPRPTASASKMRPWLRKTFPRFPFFYLGNFGKTQIRRGKILLQTWHGKKPKQNTIAVSLQSSLVIQCSKPLNFDFWVTFTLKRWLKYICEKPYYNLKGIVLSWDIGSIWRKNTYRPDKSWQHT